MSTTITHSVDELLKKTQTTTHSIDESIVRRLTKTHSIDSLRKKTQTKTHSIDVIPVNRLSKTYSATVALSHPGTTKTFSWDVRLGAQPVITHSIDANKTKIGRSVVQGVSTVLLRKTQTKSNSIDVDLYKPGSSSITDGTLDTAIASSIQRPSLRLSRVLNRNTVLENVPTLTVSESGNGNSNINDSIIDGYDRSSMKWGFADADATTNGEYRIFPDLDKFEAEASVERQKMPWVSSQLSSTSGSFSSPLQFVVHYNGSPEFNMIRIVGDQYGKGGGGIFTNVDFEVSSNGSSWTTVASGVSGLDCTESHKVQVMYYRDQNTTTLQWTSDETTFIDNTDGYDREVVTYPYIRVTVHSVSVNSYLASGERARLAQVYEAGAYLWDVGLQDVDIVTFNVDDVRDISQQSLSPVGASAANSFSITGTMANQPRPFYDTYVNPLADNNDKFQGALYIAELGFYTGSDITYVPYGKYWADDVSMSGPDGHVNISGRDFIKLLQESKMPDAVYVDAPLQSVIRDVVQRAGIEYYRIDNPDYTLAELSPIFYDEFYSNDEVERTLSSNVIWTQGQSCFEFLQTIAYADLGVFYFDHDNYFIYKSKEDLLRGDVTPDHTLYESDDIFSFNTSSEVLKNAFTITYKAPKRTDTPISLWTLDTNTTIAATGLGASISDTDDSIAAGDISDWEDQGYFQIGDEIVRYNDRDNRTFLECDRGWLGTTAASHSMITTSANWNYGGSGTWQVTGGQLKATNNGGSFDTTLSTSTWGGDSINFFCTVTITDSPFTAGLAIRASGTNNYYYVVFKTAKQGPIDGATAASDTNMYEIWQVQGGSATRLRGVPFNSAKKKMTTGFAYRLQVHMNDEEISLFVKGTRVISYTIKDTDVQIDTPAKVGMLAKGSGPTYFENVAVATLPEDKGGETLVFSDTFGRPISEIRKFEATYAPQGDGKLAAQPPCWGVRYYLTNTNYVSVILFNAGPFSATIFVKNDAEFVYSLITGALSDNQVAEQLYLTGYAINQDLQQKQQTYEDWDAITRYGRHELTLDVPWVQSDRHAKKLLKYLRQAYSLPTLFLNASVRPNPQLQLGEIVAIQSSGSPIWFPTGSDNKFYLTGSHVLFDSSGWHQSVDLRSMTWDQGFTDNGTTNNRTGL